MKVYILMADYPHLHRMFMGTYAKKENAMNARDKYKSSDRYARVRKWHIFEQYVQDV